MKKCPKCLSEKVISKGLRRGIKRYFCNNCKGSFSSKRRPKNLPEIIFRKFLYKRQILNNLAEEYSRSTRWIYIQILKYEPPFKNHNPRDITVCIDATFYGRRKDKLGSLVFKDLILKEIICWKHVGVELVSDYKQQVHMLEMIGYTIKAIIIDGKRGLYKAFKHIPIQMCHFHQRKTIIKYITKNPRLQAGKDLQKIMYSLTSSSETRFTKKLDNWHKKHKNFLDEKTVSIDTNKSYFKHKKLRSAYRSLRTNLPYLFTYKNYPDLGIQNTTNTLDGGVFSPMKKLINIHCGISKSLKLKMVDDFLVNYKVGL